MDTSTLLRFTTEGLLLCLTASLPAVVVAASVGFTVAFIQAITSIQDQTLAQAAKLVAVTITVAVVAPVSGAAVLRFANEIMLLAIPS